ncbi:MULTISPECIES: cytochrome aa3 quinol oxidase subunit I [Halobacillus]|uniref:cytochrome aa3 quinol oxidase subunit I n=1 Tax=Halobacillus TaxID=45667 RepID=UPI0009A77600|nr:MULTISPECIES: cytochrome aa3 quinol oxidase subunit I [Halobacillus]
MNLSEIKDFLIGEFFVTGDPTIYAAQVMIALTTIGIIFTLTYLKKWKWLWREWLTTVDHKKIGIMYIIVAMLMLFRGGADALMIRTQLALPNMDFLEAQTYNEVFTTHGTIMLLFMAMPFLIGLINVAMPLQIGARDVAFPYLNALSFWLFFSGAMLFNLSFIIGGSPDAGWVNYPPLAGGNLSPGPEINYYLIGLQIAGIGTLTTGINFIATILKMRAPGMTLMRMPIFTWSSLITSIIILFAFPVLTIALALLTIDRLFGSHFFTVMGEGLPEMYVNLFWLWGHPEVYILILPAFGIFSEVISTFARKRLFGYKAMVYSMIIISLLSFVVWVHHFFTMGSEPAANSFFSISTMAIAIPTGVKIFNWLLTLYKGKIKFTTAHLWALGFMPNFVIGGATGVMLASAPADYQYHNSYFLISHFHYVLISGTVFSIFAGLHYWWPKMFGHKLNERLGKWAFWLFVVGFNVTFVPMYIVGLMGMTRRVYTYEEGLGWTTLNFIETLGAYAMGIAFAIIVYNIYYSARYGERDKTGDPWDGRTLEWSIPSPAPEYNFAHVPKVKGLDAFWIMKKENKTKKKEKEPYKPIHMPDDSGQPFMMSLFFFISGFGFVWEWMWMGILGLVGVGVIMILRTFDKDEGYHISSREIKRRERAAREDRIDE